MKVNGLSPLYCVRPISMYFDNLHIRDDKKRRTVKYDCIPLELRKSLI